MAAGVRAIAAECCCSGPLMLSDCSTGNFSGGVRTVTRQPSCWVIPSKTAQKIKKNKEKLNNHYINSLNDSTRYKHILICKFNFNAGWRKTAQNIYKYRRKIK